MNERWRRLGLPISPRAAHLAEAVERETEVPVGGEADLVERVDLWAIPSVATSSVGGGSLGTRPSPPLNVSSNESLAGRVDGPRRHEGDAGLDGAAFPAANGTG